MYKEIIDKLTKQDLIEIYHNLNCWEWNDKLGDKPEGYNNLPDFLFNNNLAFPTKRDIVSPILRHIETKVSEKELMKYWHLTHCKMTNLQHEIWWITNKFSKFFGVGCYSKKSRKITHNILSQIVDRDKKDWIHKTYNY